ncbi:MAG: preprotein translocase subunit YajC [Spirochaetes bacterium RBG_13_68_11]|nr:MAG: preprotein translocase subunit YajC [Spirochaetes bacterium RBG_13_68_11]
MNAPLFNLPLMLLPTGEAGGAAGTASSGNPLQSYGILIVMPLIILVFYFLVMRPQNRKQKEAKKMLEGLRKGDRIVTIGGLRGTVVSVKDDAVVLKVDDNTKLEYSKSAVATVLKREDEATEPAKE